MLHPTQQTPPDGSRSPPRYCPVLDVSGATAAVATLDTPLARRRAVATPFVHAAGLPGAGVGWSGEAGVFTDRPVAGSRNAPPAAAEHAGLVATVRQHATQLAQGALPAQGHLDMIEHALHELDPCFRHCGQVPAALATLAVLDRDRGPSADSLEALFPELRPEPSQVRSTRHALSLIEDACRAIDAELQQLRDPAGVPQALRLPLLVRLSDALLLCAGHAPGASSGQLDFYAQAIVQAAQAWGPGLPDSPALQEMQARLHRLAREFSTQVDAAQAGRALADACRAIDSVVGTVGTHAPALADDRQDTQAMLSAVKAAAARLERQVRKHTWKTVRGDASETSLSPGGPPVHTPTRDKSELRTLTQQEIEQCLRASFATRPRQAAARAALREHYGDTGNSILPIAMSTTLDICFGPIAPGGQRVLTQLGDVIGVLQSRLAMGQPTTSVNDVCQALPALAGHRFTHLLETLQHAPDRVADMTAEAMAWRYEWNAGDTGTAAGDVQAGRTALVRQALDALGVRGTRVDGQEQVPQASLLMEWILENRGVFLAPGVISQIARRLEPDKKVVATRKRHSARHPQARQERDALNRAVQDILETASVNLSCIEILPMLVQKGLVPSQTQLTRVLRRMPGVANHNGGYYMAHKPVMLVHLKNTHAASAQYRIWKTVIGLLEQHGALSEQEMRELVMAPPVGGTQEQWTKLLHNYLPLLFRTADGKYRLMLSSDLTGEEDARSLVQKIRDGLRLKPVGTKFTRPAQIAVLGGRRHVDTSVMNWLVDEGWLDKRGPKLYVRAIPRKDGAGELPALPKAADTAVQEESDPSSESSEADDAYDSDVVEILPPVVPRAPSAPMPAPAAWDPAAHRAGVPKYLLQDPHWLAFEQYLATAPRRQDATPAAADTADPWNFVYAEPNRSGIAVAGAAPHTATGVGYSRSDFHLRRNRADGDCLLHALENRDLSLPEVLELRRMIAEVREQMPDVPGSTHNANEIAIVLLQKCGAAYASRAVRGLESVPNAALALLQRIPQVFLGNQEIQQYCRVFDTAVSIPRGEPPLRVAVVDSHGTVLLMNRDSMVRDQPRPGEDHLQHVARLLQADRLICLFKTDDHYERIEGLAGPRASHGLPH